MLGLGAKPAIGEGASGNMDGRAGRQAHDKASCVWVWTARGLDGKPSSRERPPRNKPSSRGKHASGDAAVCQGCSRSSAGRGAPPSGSGIAVSSPALPRRMLHGAGPSRRRGAADRTERAVDRMPGPAEGPSMHRRQTHTRDDPPRTPRTWACALREPSMAVERSRACGASRAAAQRSAASHTLPAWWLPAGTLEPQWSKLAPAAARKRPRAERIRACGLAAPELRCMLHSPPRPSPCPSRRLALQTQPARQAPGAELVCMYQATRCDSPSAAMS